MTPLLWLSERTIFFYFDFTLGFLFKEYFIIKRFRCFISKYPTQKLYRNPLTDKNVKMNFMLLTGLIMNAVSFSDKTHYLKIFNMKHHQFDTFLKVFFVLCLPSFSQTHLNSTELGKNETRIAISNAGSSLF